MVGKIVSRTQMRTLPSLSSYLTIISRDLLQLINTMHIHHRKFIKIRSLKQKAKSLKSQSQPTITLYSLPVCLCSALFIF